MFDRCASLDGDADRLVYFTQQGGVFQLFDGDRIAVLAALLVRDILNDLPVPPQSVQVSPSSISQRMIDSQQKPPTNVTVKLMHVLLMDTSFTQQQKAAAMMKCRHGMAAPQHLCFLTLLYQACPCGCKLTCSQASCTDQLAFASGPERKG